MRCNNHQSHGPSPAGGEIGNTGNAGLMCSHTEGQDIKQDITLERGQDIKYNRIVSHIEGPGYKIN